MKNFDNIEPMPNPKPLKVQRVRVSTKPDGTDASNLHTLEYGFIRNTNLDPSAIARKG